MASGVESTLGMTIEPGLGLGDRLSFVMPNLAAWVHAEASGCLGVSGQITDIAAYVHR